MSSNPPYDFGKLLSLIIAIIIGLVILEITNHLRENYGYRQKPSGFLRKYFLFKMYVHIGNTYLLYRMMNFFEFLYISPLEKLCKINMFRNGLMIFLTFLILEPKLALAISDALQNYFSKTILEKL